MNNTNNTDTACASSMMTVISSRHQKKAQVEIHFNWISVLLIGAVILVFFLLVSNRQKTVANQKLAADVVSEIELILTGQGISPGREDSISIPAIPLAFTCDAYGMMGMTRQTGNAIIFSPSTINANTLITWTQAWSLPFKVANILYITSPEVRYHFIYDEQNPTSRELAETLIKDLPERMDKMLTPLNDVADIPYENTDHVRLIYVLLPDALEPAMPVALKKVRDKTVSAIVLRQNPSAYAATEPFDTVGSFLFYRKNGNVFEPDTTSEGISGSYAVPGRELVYGAIFADSSEQYTCVVKKTIQRLALVAAIYRDRALRLQADTTASGKERCVAFYDTAPFERLARLSPDDFFISGQATSIPPLMSNLFADMQLLARFNSGTIRASCTTLY